jgi:hypothetical protein
MKFYNDNKGYFGWNKIAINKLTAIYCNNSIYFFKNGEKHNAKNAAYIRHSGYNSFYLNGKLYGFKYNFTKNSWRRFVKMEIFK